MLFCIYNVYLYNSNTFALYTMRKSLGVLSSVCPEDDHKTLIDLIELSLIYFQDQHYSKVIFTQIKKSKNVPWFFKTVCYKDFKVTLQFLVLLEMIKFVLFNMNWNVLNCDILKSVHAFFKCIFSFCSTGCNNHVWGVQYETEILKIVRFEIFSIKNWIFIIFTEGTIFYV